MSGVTNKAVTNKVSEVIPGGTLGEELRRCHHGSGGAAALGSAAFVPIFVYQTVFLCW